MSPLNQHYQAVLQRIHAAEQAAQRPSGSVQLIAVSKTFPADNIRQLYHCGQRAFGENYVQEWHQKTEQLRDCPDLIWHVIGHIQSNKTRPVAECADWLHTLDRAKIADRLNAQRPAELAPLNICIEINIGNEVAKHGITADELLPLARHVLALPRLRLRGLMCVATAHADDALLRQQFTQMQQLFKHLQTIVPHADTLSMGMSDDMNLAIDCGATMVRVGRAIFGAR